MFHCQGRAKEGFSNGYLRIRKDNHYLFINSYGQNKFNTTFSDAKPFEDKLAIVKNKSSYGMINTDGQYVISPSYDILNKPINGVSITGQLKAYGVCDLDGIYIISPKCNAIVYNEEADVFKYTYKNEFGYFTSDGKVIWNVD